MSKMRIFVGYKAWKSEEYLLNRMTFDDLVRAYITYPAIQIYALILIGSLAIGIWKMGAIWPFLASIAAGMLLFPIAWYVTHRFILHGSWMFKTPFLASLWKRVHYDHHRFPNDLSVLFGGLHTTLPTIFLAAGPLGWLIHGAAGAAGAIAGTVIMTCVTEFLHAGEHLAFEPKSKFWKDMKRRHLAHHFHDESGNFGIAEFFWDRIFGTFYDKTEERNRSATARNLGYTDETAKKYPWVKELTDAEPQTKQAMRSS
ncbi:MAG: sterol desaturase family protein [Marinicaulis sp.]|nr:sterol desaturase family protein [Marinicaulis sp.]